MSRSAYRHCQCTNALIDILVGNLEQSGQGQIPLALILRKQRGHTLVSCPGTELPNILWGDVEAKIKKMITDTLMSDDLGLSSFNANPADTPATRLYEHDVAGKLAASMVRVVSSMWAMTFESRIPKGMAVPERSRLN